MAKPSAPRVVTLPRGVLRAMQAAGIDLEAHARAVGVDSAAAPMAPAQRDQLVARALDAIGDPTFALRTGAHVRPELFGVIGFAVMAARTFGEALARTARYNRVLGGGLIDLVPEHGGLTLRHRGFPGAHDAVDQASVDFILASMVATGRLFTDAHVNPTHVALRRSPPRHAAAFRSILGATPVFDARHDEIAFSARDLARPMISQSSERGAYFVERAERMLAETDVAPRIQRVCTAISELLGSREPTLHDVARSLGTSERSLQRQLAADGTSYSAVLDQVRHAEVCAQLAASDIDLAELAARVGFSGTTALHRAFRRWEGTTPLAYRTRSRLAASC